MDPLTGAAMLAMVAIAATAILLLRSATIARHRLLEVATRTRPDPPVVDVRSPAFVATATGSRYHLGCMVGETDFRYAIWTTRSHRVVATLDPTEEGWAAAWDLYLEVEHDPAPPWLDHRGAPRSRREWTSRTAGRAHVAATSEHEGAPFS